MSADRYSALGKQVLEDGYYHVADARNPQFAGVIAHALNVHFALLTPAYPDASTTPSTEGQGE